MRIYSTELLAAAAFIASISSYSASGSKIAQPELSTSDRAPDREDGATEEQALQTIDEAEREARMQPPSEVSASIAAANAKLSDSPGSTVATAVQTRLAQLDDGFAKALISRPESSEMAAKRLAQDPNDRRYVPPQTTGGAPLSEADLLELFEQARVYPQFLSSETLRKLNDEALAPRNARSSTPFTLLDLLIEIYRAKQGDFSELVSALSKAKAGEIISKDEAYALEETMLQYWKAKKVSFSRAYNFLGLSDLATRADLTDKNLDLLQRYYALFDPDSRRNILHACIRHKINNDGKLFLMIMESRGESSFANEMLAYIVKLGINRDVRPANILTALRRGKANDLVVVRLLTMVVVQERAKLDTRQETWTNLMNLLKEELVSRWLNSEEVTPGSVLSLFRLTDLSSIPEKVEFPSSVQKNVELDIFKTFVEGYNKKMKTGIKAEEMYTNERMAPAEARQERAPKRQRITGLSIRR
uniref:RxLR effector candidate protein n=1 Tax=Peronospora matthiolae TaxID=2874970 RepID=A0AAV1U9E8_9STRA